MAIPQNRLEVRYSPKGLESAFSEIQAVGSTHIPHTVRTDDGPRFRFSATVGQEPEVEVALV
jgi:predicted ATP-binding protein involved in virulence